MGIATPGHGQVGLVRSAEPGVSPPRAALEYEDLQSALCQTRRHDDPAEARAHHDDV